MLVNARQRMDVSLAFLQVKLKHVWIIDSCMFFIDLFCEIHGLTVAFG